MKKKHVTKRTLLLDGDVVAYQIAFKAEKPIKWDEDTWTLHADETEAKGELASYLASIKEQLNCQRLVIALSCPSDECWRKSVYEPYKENRRGARKPMLLAPLKQYMRDEHEVWERSTLEADDVLGILSTSPTLITGEKIIASIDKDFKTIPGLHFHLKNRERGVYSVTETEADYWHMFQTLTGDTADGFPGCPAIGPKRASVLLEEGSIEDLWPIVVGAYAKAGLDEDEAIRQARIARILRRDDYNFKKKEVILWNPSTSER